MKLTESTLHSSILVDFKQFAPEYLWDNVIGRQNFIDIALSAANSPEQKLGGSGFARSFPMLLFVGAAGSGKKTLDECIAGRILDILMDFGGTAESFRWYRVPSGGLDGNNAEEICENITLLFDAAEKDIASEDYFVFLSLGDLSSTIRKKKSARLLSERLRSLKAKSNECLITAHCESVRILPQDIFEQFMPLKLPAPNEKQREEYFQRAKEAALGVKWEMSVEKLVKLTENFSFGKLRQIIDMTFCLAEGKIIASGGDVNDYMLVTDKPPISITEEDFSFMIDSLSFPQENTTPDSLERVILKEVHSDTQAERDKIAENKSKDTQKTKTPNTPSEMNKMLEELPIYVVG